jgi:CRISPR-associated protein Csd1
VLVQSLAGFADEYLAEALGDSAFESKPVPWMIEISPQGNFLDLTKREHQELRGKKSVKVANEMRVPRSPVNRNSGHHPLIAVDDIGYVLGPGPWTQKSSDRKKQEGHFAAFVNLLRKAAAETSDETLEACVKFYDNPSAVAAAQEGLKEAKAGTLVALSVAGPIVDKPAVQTFWRKHYRSAFDQRMEGAKAECMISGKFGSIAPTHEKIKGLSSLGGQAAGVALMSFDKEAFRSYGWDQNANSPVSPNRAMAYVLAINYLLKSRKHRYDFEGVGFIYWLRKNDPFDWTQLMIAADPEQIKALLRFDPGAKLDENQFFMAGISGNGGRLRIRYWVNESLGQIKANLKSWHQQLQIDYPWDHPGPIRLCQLNEAIHREGKPPANQVQALIRRGIEGESRPLGYEILTAALRRLKRAEWDKWECIRISVSLIRMCVNDLIRTNSKDKKDEKEKEMDVALDRSCELKPYLCGRLLAIYENLQQATYAAAGESKVNNSIADRYFSMASSFPMMVFPKIAELGEKHMSKLRKQVGERSRRIAGGIQKELDEVYSRFHADEQGPFPPRFSLKEQGLFVLGYYQQKAYRRKSTPGAAAPLTEDQNELFTTEESENE